MLGRAAPAEAARPLRGYADDLGLAFQIRDDLLDRGGDGVADRQGRRPRRRGRQGHLRAASLGEDGRGRRARASCAGGRWRALTSSATAPRVLRAAVRLRDQPKILNRSAREFRCDMPSTPLLDQVHEPCDLRGLDRAEPRAAGGRAAAGDHRRGVGDRRPSRRRAGRGRAHRGAAPRLRHAARPADLGRRPPGLPAQDPDRPARPHPHAAPAGRPLRLHPPGGERLRPVRRRAQLDLDLGRPRHGDRGQARRHRAQRDRGDRRRGDERRHGLRGHEQHRRHARPADRDPQRQRHVDRPAGRGDERLPVEGGLLAHLSRLPPRRQAAHRVLAVAAADRGLAGGGVRARARHRRHAVRGAGLLLHRPARRPQSRPPDPGARERARRQATAGRC